MAQQGYSLRPDFAATRNFFKDPRPEDRIVAHYLLERRLAARLRDAPPGIRRDVYMEVYDELFRSLPDHPQRMAPACERERHVRSLIKRLLPHLGGDKTFLEIGCGDAVLSSALAGHVARGYALDVTDRLIDRSQIPQNVEVLLTPGTGIPLPSGSVDLALSDQLMEHLHPDDAAAQLEQVARVLKPGGTYHCITPNQVTGPHDVSCYFDYEATGFHLCEYASASLSDLFKRVGFRQVKFFAAANGFEVRVPAAFVRAIEAAISAMPRAGRAWAARHQIVQAAVGLDVVGVK